jgi:hypothetical protein
MVGSGVRHKKNNHVREGSAMSGENPKVNDKVLNPATGKVEAILYQDERDGTWDVGNPDQPIRFHTDGATPLRKIGRPLRRSDFIAAPEDCNAYEWTLDIGTKRRF